MPCLMRLHPRQSMPQPGLEVSSINMIRFSLNNSTFYDTFNLTIAGGGAATPNRSKIFGVLSLLALSVDSSAAKNGFVAFACS
jgi:hypothetical protein